MACRCSKCGRIVDCNGDDLCELCECMLEIADIEAKSHTEPVRVVVNEPYQTRFQGMG